jgi:cyclohexanecarboxylate-CoA ligase
VLTEAARTHPDRTALVGYRRDGATVRRTYAEADADSHHAAEALASLGVGPGDVVAVMLANRVEYPALVYGINEVGAIYTGIPVAYRERQARAIVQHSQTRVLVISRSWHGADHLALSRLLRAAVPTLERVIVLDDGPDDLDDGEVAWSSRAEGPARTFEPLTPAISAISDSPPAPRASLATCLLRAQA